MFPKKSNYCNDIIEQQIDDFEKPLPYDETVKITKNIYSERLLTKFSGAAEIPIVTEREKETFIEKPIYYEQEITRRTQQRLKALTTKVVLDGQINTTDSGNYQWIQHLIENREKIAELLSVNNYKIPELQLLLRKKTLQSTKNSFCSYIPQQQDFTEFVQQIRMIKTNSSAINQSVINDFTDFTVESEILQKNKVGQKIQLEQNLLQQQIETDQNFTDELSLTNNQPQKIIHQKKLLQTFDDFPEVSTQQLQQSSLKKKTITNSSKFQHHYDRLKQQDLLNQISGQKITNNTTTINKLQQNIEPISTNQEIHYCQKSANFIASKEKLPQDITMNFTENIPSTVTGNKLTTKLITDNSTTINLPVEIDQQITADNNNIGRQQQFQLAAINKKLTTITERHDQDQLLLPNKNINMRSQTFSQRALEQENDIIFAEEQLQSEKQQKIIVTKKLLNLPINDLIEPKEQLLQSFNFTISQKNQQSLLNQQVNDSQQLPKEILLPEKIQQQLLLQKNNNGNNSNKKKIYTEQEKEVRFTEPLISQQKRIQLVNEQKKISAIEERNHKPQKSILKTTRQQSKDFFINQFDQFGDEIENQIQQLQ